MNYGRNFTAYIDVVDTPISRSATTDAINDIDLSTFLKLMITELQNQDPLNPLDNKDMLAQISQIREVGATDKLTQTLDSVLLGQNIASATNLIGADVTAISDDGESVDGIVNRVSIDKGAPKLHVENATGDRAVDVEDGDVEAGTYGYRVVWEDDEATCSASTSPATSDHDDGHRRHRPSDSAAQLAGHRRAEANLPHRRQRRRRPYQLVGIDHRRQHRHRSSTSSPTTSASATRLTRNRSNARRQSPRDRTT